MAHRVGRKVMTRQLFLLIKLFHTFFLIIGISHFLITPAVHNFISYGPPRSVKNKNQKQNIEAKEKGLCWYFV